MRVAWFSPLPPVRSGIAGVSEAVVAQLDAELVVDRYGEQEAHDFVWRHRRAPYDLVVYHIGNAACHDYIWAYVTAYPGLVVLHDPRVHHARARNLLQQGRFDDYRREFRYNHPEAVADFAEYAVEGLGGPIYYTWSMAGVLVRTAKMVAVHNVRAADDLRQTFPDARVQTIRLGTPPLTPAADARRRIRAQLGITGAAVAFAVFGKLTPEKRIAPILDAFGALLANGIDAHLLLAGDASGYPGLDTALAASPGAARIHAIGYIADAAIGDYLAASDACLCLRWPTALETSASWLQCLSAARATIISDLAHLVDVPDTVALKVGLLDEVASLSAAMQTLAADVARRDAVAGAGYGFWSANHTMEVMADDYRRLIPIAAGAPAPSVADLPAHFRADHSATARALAAPFGISIDDLL